MNLLPYIGMGSRPARTAGRHRSIVRLLLATLVAHVTIDPAEAPKGRFARLAFRVPTERDDAGITRFVVRFPTEHPVKHVSVRPTPGWAYEVETAQLQGRSRSGLDGISEAVSAITWTGGEIRPGEFDEFVVALGPLPSDTARLLFPATETYADGEVVHFGSGPGGSSSSDDHPTPALTLIDAEDSSAGHTHDYDVDHSPDTQDTKAGTTRPWARTTASQESTVSVKRLALANLAVAIIGLCASVAALLRSRRTTTLARGASQR